MATQSESPSEYDIEETSSNVSGSSMPVLHGSFQLLACTSCRHRKIKCDRKFPCSNCTRMNGRCVPTRPTTSRKPRRLNRELGEQLSRCELLLDQCASLLNIKPPSAIPILISPAASPSQFPAVTRNSEQHKHERRLPGRLVWERNGSVRFTDSHVWASIHEELKGIRQNSDLDGQGGSIANEDRDPRCATQWPGSSESTQSAAGVWPKPTEVFKLWQFFLDRVNPLLKVVHVPSLQQHIVEAATSMDSITLNYQALLFAVFTMAVLSLTEIESIQTLGMTREEALSAYTSGTKKVISQLNPLLNFDMTVLQALLLHLFSLHNRYDRHAAWILSGMVVRIAQKMGYHRDGETLGLPPFETEMRRRIWWQILVQDSKMALVSGLNDSMLPNKWNTKPPQNLNDVDLFIDSTEPTEPREGPTEMCFCLLVYEITKFTIEADGIHGIRDFESDTTDQHVDDLDARIRQLQKYQALVDKLDDDLRVIEARIINLIAGPVHAAALTMRPMVIGKLREMLVPMTQQPEWGTEIFNASDNWFKNIVINNEKNTACYNIMQEKGFFWFCRLHFQLELFTSMTGQLHHRTNGSIVNRAWNVVERVYSYHCDLFDMKLKSSATQAQIVLRAWSAREDACARTGTIIPPPQFINQLRECASPGVHGLEYMPELWLKQQNGTPLQTGEPVLSVETDEEVPFLNWDMLGDFLPFDSE